MVDQYGLLMENSILTHKEKIKKYRDQMSNATTNKEYQGFISEIKFIEDKITSIEEEIIEKMLESDEIMEEIKKSENEFKQIASTYDEKIAVLNSKLNDIKNLLSKEIKEKEVIEKDVPERMLKVYNQLFTKKNGKAISVVEKDFCGVCHVKIRPQLLNELITSDQLFICENCGRIFYMPVWETDKSKKVN